MQLLSELPKEIQKKDTPITNKINQPIVHKFLETMSHLSDSTKTMYIMRINEFISYLNSGISNKKRLDIFILEDFLSYENYLEKKVESGELKTTTVKEKLRVIKKLSLYLYSNKLTDFIYENKLSHSRASDKVLVPEVVKEFLMDISSQNYSHIDKYRRNIMYFFKFLGKSSDHSKKMQYFTNDVRMVTNFEINKYHKFLAKRVELEEISKSRALLLLASLRLFFKYLNKTNKNNLKYIIPDNFRTQGSRLNIHVNNDKKEKLIEALLLTSKNPERDLSIFLILIDTGCRPIELVNMMLTDVFLTESSIILYSKKSGQRKLIINNAVKNQLMEYLEIRKSIRSPSNNLFLNKDLNPISTKGIYYIFAKANEEAFGEMIYSPKTFRHT